MSMPDCHHSPEDDPALLRAELDACRTEIARLRRLAALAEAKRRVGRRRVTVPPPRSTR